MVIALCVPGTVCLEKEIWERDTWKEIYDGLDHILFLHSLFEATFQHAL